MEHKKLSTGLVTIVNESRKTSKPDKNKQKGNSSFRTLFIANPAQANADAADLYAANVRSKQDLLRETLAKAPTKADNFTEIFSTHPNIIKRLQALQELS